MIYVIIVIIGSICLFSLLGLYLLASQWFKSSKDLKLKQYRYKDEGLSDLLNYAALIDDGIIVGKNGALMASWLYRGQDYDSSTASELEDTSMRINFALKELGSGWMMHVDSVRFPSPGYPDANESYFPDPISAAIDEERRQFFLERGVLYEGYFIITLTYLPPYLSEQKIADLMFDDETIKHSEQDNQDKIIEKFKKKLEVFENNLNNARLNLRRLHSYKTQDENGDILVYDDQLRWVNRCVTGNDHNILLPDSPIYLDTILGNQELYTGVVPKIGNKYIQIVSIDGFPMESYPGILNKLTLLPIEYRWSNRYIFLDPHQAVAELDKYKKKWKQKIRGIVSQVFNTASTSVNLDAVNMVEDAELAIEEVNSGTYGQGYYTSCVILMHEDREYLESLAVEFQKDINSLGFTSRIESINTMEAYLGSLPGHGVQNIRRPMISTGNLADFFPTNTIWTGSLYCECNFYPPESPPLMQVVTHGSSPFRLNTHIGDVGHIFIFGPTGAGKSTHFAIMAAQFLRYRDMQIYAFDKGHSMETLVKATGGSHFSIGDDIKNDIGESLTFCPLALVEDTVDLGWFIDWFETIMELNDLKITAKQRNEVESAVKSILSSGNISLSDLSNQIQDNEIREVLKTYTLDGAMGYLLDGESDQLTLSRFTCFEMEELMNLGEKYVLPVLLFLFRKIEKSLDGSPTVIFLDEAWVLLGHPTFREKIKKWLKEMRKKNCSVVMATQSLSDAANSGIFDVINESCPTKIFLPNYAAREEDASLLYKRLGLNPRQIEIIAKAIPKQQYYYNSPRGRRLYELALGDLALAFVAVSDPEKLVQVNSYIEQYQKSWPKYYLKDMGINLEEYVNLEDYANV